MNETKRNKTVKFQKQSSEVKQNKTNELQFDHKKMCEFFSIVAKKKKKAVDDDHHHRTKISIIYGRRKKKFQ